MTLQLRSRLKTRYTWPEYLDTGIKRTYFQWEPSTNEYIRIPLTRKLTAADTMIATVDGRDGNQLDVYDIRHRSREYVLEMTDGGKVTTCITPAGEDMQLLRFSHLFDHMMAPASHIPREFYDFIKDSAGKLGHQRS